MEFVKKLMEDGYSVSQISKIVKISTTSVYTIAKTGYEMVGYENWLQSFAEDRRGKQKTKGAVEPVKEFAKEFAIEEVQKILDHVNDDQLIGILDLVVKELLYRQQEVSPRGRFK